MKGEISDVALLFNDEDVKIQNLVKLFFPLCNIWKKKNIQRFLLKNCVNDLKIHLVRKNGETLQSVYHFWHIMKKDLLNYYKVIKIIERSCLILESWIHLN
jgi:hypothetical protein